MLLKFRMHDRVSFLFDSHGVFIKSEDCIFTQSYCSVTGLGCCANTKLHAYRQSVQSFVIVDADLTLWTDV